MYKTGQVLAVTDGITSSAVKILTNEKVIVIEGFGLGQTMTLEDWRILTGTDGAPGDSPQPTFRRVDSLDVSAMRKNRKLKSILKNPNLTPESAEPRIRRMSSCSSTSSSSTSSSSTSSSSRVEFSNVVQVHPIEKRKVSVPWYYKIFLCGLIND